MLSSPLLYFTDPILRAPMIGSILLCFVSALVGVLVFLRKETLLGESLSHSTYPGVILGVLGANALGFQAHDELGMTFFIMIGAALGALAGLYAIRSLVLRVGIRNDSALCFILAAFFGVGLTLASRLQFTHTESYRQIQAYLYGQAATMTDVHIAIYGVLSLLSAGLFILFFKELKTTYFDRDYAKSQGVPVQFIETLFFFLVVLSVVIGIRCVGVILMSAMLIAPAIAARQHSHHLHIILFFAALYGTLSGFLGNYLSIELASVWVPPGARPLPLPTGPMIVLCSSVLCLFALLFAPDRGLFQRVWRIFWFRHRCRYENLLKGIWRLSPQGEISFDQLMQIQGSSRWLLLWQLKRLQKRHLLVQPQKQSYSLTSQGRKKAAHIVRLHRLWELYLADCLGMGVDRVHRSAEEMEHIITPDLEARLTKLLHNPQKDPHQQPIPPKQEVDSSC